MCSEDVCRIRSPRCRYPALLTVQSIGVPVEPVSTSRLRGKTFVLAIQQGGRQGVEDPVGVRRLISSIPGTVWNKNVLDLITFSSHSNKYTVAIGSVQETLIIPAPPSMCCPHYRRYRGINTVILPKLVRRLISNITGTVWSSGESITLYQLYIQLIKK